MAGPSASQLIRHKRVLASFLMLARSLRNDAGGLEMEHRWGIRYLLDVPVRVEGLPSSLAFARLQNVSSSGAYVATKAAPALDSRVLLELGCGLGTRVGRCRVPACVVRRDERGIGVEWCEFAPQPVLAFIATAWQADVFEAREDRAASQALPLARESRSSARLGAWSSSSMAARSTAGTRL